MSQNNKTALFLSSCFALFVLSGCSTINLNEVNQQYYEGDANKAYSLAQQGANVSTDNQTAKGDELLWRIQGGIIGFDLEDENAEHLLEIAEKNINQNEEEGILSNFFKNAEAILVNDTIIPYQGFLYEGVMVNYYKALLYMSQQKYADARVEFNRASDRQRRLKEYYVEEIAKTKEAQQKVIDKEKVTQNQEDEYNKILQTYSNLDEFAHLENHINPAIDYIAGIFFMLQGDHNKAQDFLKEAYGITQSSIIAEDLNSTQNRQEKQTWILIEDGKSPSKIEKRFYLPIFTQGSGLLHVTLALPDMQKGIDFANSYALYDSSNTQQAQGSKIATLDPLAFNEFRKQLPFIITRAMLSTTIKTLAQHVALQAVQGDSIAELFVSLGGAFAQMTTQADLRISTMMPNSFHVIKIKNVEGKFDLKADDQLIISLDFSATCQKDLQQICVNKDNILYIRNAQNNIFKRVLFSK